MIMTFTCVWVLTTCHSVKPPLYKCWSHPCLYGLVFAILGAYMCTLDLANTGTTCVFLSVFVWKFMSQPNDL